jgi:hypothetical protein
MSHRPGNTIRAAGVRTFAEALKLNRTLSTLDLGCAFSNRVFIDTPFRRC